MTEQSVDEELGIRLGRVARLWRSEINRRLMGFGLTDAQWLALVHLARLGEPAPQKVLARAVGVREPTMARMIDRLEADGFATRSAHASDRRTKLVRLTSKAFPTIKRIQDVGKALRAEIFMGIDQADIETCLRVFEGLEARLREKEAICEAPSEHSAE